MKTLKTQLSGAALCGVIALGVAQSSQAVNLVVNGGFETLTAGPGQLGFNTVATGWNMSGGYTFAFAAGTGDTTGAVGQFGGITLWGPNNGGANTPNTLPAASPAGGNYVLQDADFQQAALTQTITGLTVGGHYDVSFYWAAGQQSGFDGPTAENWTVGLGAQTQTTTTIQLPSHGFSGWFHTAFGYTATSTSEVLSFMAGGSPQGPPPFALLDGVQVNQSVPDTSSTALLCGLAAVVIFVAPRLRRQQ